MDGDVDDVGILKNATHEQLLWEVIRLRELVRTLGGAAHALELVEVENAELRESLAGYEKAAMEDRRVDASYAHDLLELIEAVRVKLGVQNRRYGLFNLAEAQRERRGEVDPLILITLRLLKDHDWDDE